MEKSWIYKNQLKKMSKSDGNNKGSILLLDYDIYIRKKIMSAVKDSDNRIYYDVENKPGISNLLLIYSSLKNISVETAEKIFKDSNYVTFKKSSRCGNRSNTRYIEKV